MVEPHTKGEQNVMQEVINTFSNLYKVDKSLFQLRHDLVIGIIAKVMRNHIQYSVKQCYGTFTADSIVTKNISWICIPTDDRDFFVTFSNSKKEGAIRVIGAFDGSPEAVAFKKEREVIYVAPYSKEDYEISRYLTLHDELQH